MKTIIKIHGKLLQHQAQQRRLGDVQAVATAVEARLQLAANVFTHVREGILIVDAQSTIVEVNEALVIERSKNAPDWRNPVWRHADGAVAEW